jgi:hypothetical protein
MGGGRSKNAHQRLQSKKSETEALNVVSILGLQGVGKSTGMMHGRVRVRPCISHTHTHTTPSDEAVSGIGEIRQI